MSDTRMNGSNSGCGDFREAVCIDAGRVYDSCCDRDCLEDLRCYFTGEGQCVIDKALNIRAKSAEVFDVYIDVEPVTFNRGYYSCSLNFFFLVEFDVFTGDCPKPTTVKGFCFYEKKVILFGSEGNVRVFSNAKTLEHKCDPQHPISSNTPRCSVQTVDPIVLSARLCELRNCCENSCCVPSCLCDALGGNVNMCQELGTPTVLVTLGLFSIVQLIRNVQMLVPVYDFCIPEKQCEDSTDRPCDVFSRLEFPTDDFFPRSGGEGGCGCGTSPKNC